MNKKTVLGGKKSGTCLLVLKKNGRLHHTKVRIGDAATNCFYQPPNIQKSRYSHIHILVLIRRFAKSGPGGGFLANCTEAINERMHYTKQWTTGHVCPKQLACPCRLRVFPFRFPVCAASPRQHSNASSKTPTCSHAEKLASKAQGTWSLCQPFPDKAGVQWPQL